MPLYEAHLPVSDLARSIAFYRDVVGLVPAFSQPERGVAFLWVERAEVGMLGLWLPGTAYGWAAGAPHHRSHFALSVPFETLTASIGRLRGLGLKPFGFDGQPAAEPSVIGWMPSAQIYFPDPDGHVVEYITILPHQPVDNFFGSWSDWQKISRPKKPSA